MPLPKCFLQFLPKLQGTDVHTHCYKHRPAEEPLWHQDFKAAASLLLTLVSWTSSLSPMHCSLHPLTTSQVAPHPWREWWERVREIKDSPQQHTLRPKPAPVIKAHTGIPTSAERQQLSKVSGRKSISRGRRRQRLMQNRDEGNKVILERLRKLC